MSKSLDINWDAIEAIYIFSPKKISLADLTRQCQKQGIKVSQGTIGNRAKEGQWVKKRDEYWKKITKDVEKRITTQITQRRLKNIQIVDATIKLGAKNLLTKLKEDKNFVLSAADIDRLMRLQEFLLGYSDSRQEKRIVLSKPLSEMTDDELEEAKNKVLEASYEVIEQTETEVKNNE